MRIGPASAASERLKHCLEGGRVALADVIETGHHSPKNERAVLSSSASATSFFSIFVIESVITVPIVINSVVVIAVVSVVVVVVVVVIIILVIAVFVIVKTVLVVAFAAVVIVATVRLILPTVDGTCSAVVATCPQEKGELQKQCLNACSPDEPK